MSKIFEIAFKLGGELTSSFTNAINEANKSFKGLQATGEAMQSVGKTLSMTVTAPIIAMGTAAVAAAIDFESAFAGVKKTIDSTDEGYAKLEAGIREMAKTLPATASEIAAVAESAGQLGIAEESILSFSRTIVDLGESTNMTREQAATEFARFANIVGMSQGDFDRLGSSIVGLGNTMATTESEIMSMGMRLAGQGAQVGMAESEIMALSATMSSLGIGAESGGTAMTTILKKIQTATGSGGKELKAFAKVAGMSSNEFKTAFETNAVGALDSLVKGLAASGAEGENLTGVLSTLGIKGIYESDVLLRMSGASDLLSSALDTAGTSWEENTALANEAEQRYATTASQLAILKNKVTDVAITIGGILLPIILEVADEVGVWIDKFAALDEGTMKTIMIISAVAAAVGPVLIVMGTLTKSIVSVMRAFEVLKVFLMANPFILAVGAIVALGTAFVALYKHSETFRSAVDPLLALLKTGFVAGFEQVKGAVMDAIPQVISIVSEVIPLITNIAITILPMLLNVFQQVFPMIVSVISTIIPIVVQIITGVIPVILMIAKEIIPMLLNVIQQVFPMVLSVIQSVLPVVANLLKIVIDVVMMLVESVLPLIITVVEAVFPIVLAIIQAIIPIIVGVLGSLIAIIQGVLLPAINAILGVVQLVFPYIQLIIENALAIVNGIIQTAMALLQGDWDGAWNTIKTTAETIMTNIISFFQGINLFEVGKSIINGLIDGIASMGSAVVTAISGLIPEPIRGAASKLLGALPGYAEGGVVSAPTLAWVGEGGDTESIIPWNNSQRSKDLWLQTGQALGMLGQDEKNESSITQAMTVARDNINNVPVTNNVVNMMDYVQKMPTINVPEIPDVTVHVAPAEIINLVEYVNEQPFKLPDTTVNAPPAEIIQMTEYVAQRQNDIPEIYNDIQTPPAEVVNLVEYVNEQPFKLPDTTVNAPPAEIIQMTEYVAQRQNDIPEIYNDIQTPPAEIVNLVEYANAAQRQNEMLNDSSVLENMKYQIDMKLQAIENPAISPEQIGDTFNSSQNSNSNTNAITVHYNPQYNVSKADDLAYVKQHADKDKADLLDQIEELQRNERRLAF